MSKENMTEEKTDEKAILEASAEGFVHMSQATFQKLYADKEAVAQTKYGMNDLSNELERTLPNNPKYTDSKITITTDTEFNDGCAHGHRKCCIRVVSKVSASGGHAESVALYSVYSACQQIAEHITPTDPEVQIHRIRLLSTKDEDNETWVRPDNYDPNKGPKIHGC